MWLMYVVIMQIHVRTKLEGIQSVKTNTERNREKKRRKIITDSLFQIINQLITTSRHPESFCGKDPQCY